jgi:hypothetical protein
MRLLTFLLLAALLALPTARARAEDWPEFRGPTGQGHVRQGRLPLEWGPEKNVVWKQGIPGLGWSSPVVVAGRVSSAAVDDEVWVVVELCPVDVPEDPFCALALAATASAHTQITATRLAISRLQNVRSIEPVILHDYPPPHQVPCPLVLHPTRR